MSGTNGAGNGAGGELLLDPKAAARMLTIQGVGLQVERGVETVQVEMHVRKGVVAGLVSAQRQIIPKVMAEIQRRIDLPEEDATHLDGDAVKIALQWLAQAVQELGDAVLLNQRELVKQEGIVEGMLKSVTVCESLYKQEEQKALRRQNDEERGSRDGGGRPIPLRERFGADEKSPGDEKKSTKAAALADGRSVPESSLAAKRTRRKSRAG